MAAASNISRLVNLTTADDAKLGAWTTSESSLRALGGMPFASALDQLYLLFHFPMPSSDYR